MICRFCSANVDESQYSDHLEGHLAGGGHVAPEEQIAHVDGINTVLARNNNDPSRRLSRPSDFGILGQD
jgi:hypothetical protein